MNTQDHHGSDVSMCRFIDSQDRRCSKRFSLGRIREVFSFCVNDHQACPIFQQKMDDHEPASAELTIYGEPVGAI